MTIDVLHAVPDVNYGIHLFTFHVYIRIYVFTYLRKLVSVGVDITA
jgi:hypothetical protein